MGILPFVSVRRLQVSGIMGWQYTHQSMPYLQSRNLWYRIRSWKNILSLHFDCTVGIFFALEKISITRNCKNLWRLQTIIFRWLLFLVGKDSRFIVASEKPVCSGGGHFIWRHLDLRQNNDIKSLFSGISGRYLLYPNLGSLRPRIALSGNPFPELPVENRTFLHIFSEIAFLLEIGANGAIYFEL